MRIDGYTQYSYCGGVALQFNPILFDSSVPALFSTGRT